MKLLITGASGFVGRYFVENYKDKYEIKAFSFRDDDIATLECGGLDVVLHLSALVHQMRGASAEEYERINVTQTLALAKKAKGIGVSHFVFMSTVKVYGEETDGVYTESSPCHPEDEYGKSKLKAENELLKLEDDNFRVSILRTPIVYGFGVKANIRSLVDLVKKVPILPFGGIENRRSMVYVGNLCYLVDAIIRLPVKLGMKEGVFLACDDEPLSTTRLCKLMADELGKVMYLVKVPCFKTFLRLVKPSFYKRLYGSLEVDNTLTMQKLFGISSQIGNNEYKMPYSVEEGINLMIKGESI